MGDSVERRIVAVIPARLESTRLERKLLLSETGKPLILHTVEAVRRCKRFDCVYVATDSKEIGRVVGLSGAAEVVITGPANNGTERIAAAMEKIGWCDLVTNIQADEPEIQPHYLSDLVDAALAIPFCDMATLSTGATVQDQECKDVVKVRKNVIGSYATEFSRDLLANGHRHIGVYAYRPEFLRWFVAQKPTASETSRKLEQMRALDKGCRIRVVNVPHHPHGIDTRRQYDQFVERFKRKAEA